VSIENIESLLERIGIFCIMLCKGKNQEIMIAENITAALAYLISLQA
jgi:hypothetical protein